MKNNQELTGGAKKVAEYVGRINQGEASKDEVMRDLPEVFRSAIEEKLKAEAEAKKVAYQTEDAAAHIRDQEKANEVRQELGIPEVAVGESPQNIAVELAMSKGRQTAEDVRAAFAAMSEGFKGAGKEKLREYSERLKAAYNGTPMKLGDTVKNLEKDFKRFSQVDWTPDFDVEKFLGEADNNQAEKVGLIEKIKQAYDGIRREKRMTLGDEMFAIGKGINPESGELFEAVSGEVGINFDAHGISKDRQLDSLLALLDNGVDSGRDFFTAPFEVTNDVRAGLASALGTAGGTAYKEGLAVVTSGYKEKLQENGIKHVFVNDVFANIKQPLQEAYPQYQFHLLSEQKAVLEGEAARAEKK